jgi:hypothetical protein
MITMVSTWRNLRQAEGVARNLEVVCRLPDAGSMKYVSAHAIDLGSTSRLEAVRNGDTLRMRVPQHGKATVILLSARPEQALEGK